MVKETKLPESKCLGCGKELDGATEAFGDSLPSPGDISVCIYCGHISAFNDNLNLRELTSNEIHKIAGDKRILAMQKARGLVMNKKDKNE